MLASLFAKSRSRRRVRDLVRALHEGVKGETPTPEEIQRWIRAVEGGKTHAEIAAAIVASLRVAASGARARQFDPQSLWSENLRSAPGHFYSPIAEPKEAAEGVKRADRYRSLSELAGDEHRPRRPGRDLARVLADVRNDAVSRQAVRRLSLRLRQRFLCLGRRRGFRPWCANSAPRRSSKSAAAGLRPASWTRWKGRPVSPAT